MFDKVLIENRLFMVDGVSQESQVGKEIFDTFDNRRTSQAPTIVGM